ncbi:MAG: peptidyl-prolyl cis-trans isomerase [Thermoanaerobaculales bacterium]|jgi:peptidyl-prolyl cis-trans isomerase D|nr:peptidyl-prolyl cis-trans isomerase [Thermoanaerobaculales bacterium]
MALKWLRDNLRHLKFILWGVVAVFVLLVFVDWGAGRAGGGGAGAAVQIGTTKVSEQEFLDEMRRLDQRFAQIYGERWNDIRAQVDLAGQTASYFIDRELQLAEARRIGLKVPPSELREAILANPSFQREGGEFVGSETYERIVRAYFRMSTQAFEQRLAEDLMIGKLNALAERTAWVSDGEVEREYRRQRDVADLEILQLRYEPFLAGGAATEAEARAAYERDSESYRRDEQRAIRYLLVESAKLRRLLPVEAAELRAYYDEHKDEFLEGEQANARHILIRVAPDADQVALAEAELLANGVAQIARSGADFAELAAKHSQDPGSKDGGGDLGWFARGRMVKEFEDAVFAAKPGEIVGPIRSQFGFHIIRVDGFRPAHQRPFEEVEEQVRFAVVEGRAAAEAEARAAALSRRLASAKPQTDEEWQAIADEDEAVVLNRSPLFSAGQPIPGTVPDTSLTTEAFAAEVGALGGPLAVPRGWIVWQLAEVHPEGVRPFEEVRAEVEQAVRRDKALALAAERGREIAARWRAGEDPAVLAAELGTTLIVDSDHRRDTTVSSLGAIPAVDDAVFTAAAGDIVGPLPAGARGVVVVRVADLQLADPAGLAAERESLRARLMAARAGRLLRASLNEQRRDTEITIDNELLQRFSPASS